MKTKSIKLLIVCLILITGVTGAYNSVYAQSKKEAKKAMKEAEKAMLTANFYAQDTILNLREFVLEADYLQGRRGELVPVSSTINFVKVLGERGTLQTGSNTAIGSNALGGVTAEGNISNYKVTSNTKSLTHRITFDLMTSGLGIYNIVINVMANNTASATITDATSLRLTWKGELVALFNTRIFRGQDTYRR